VRNNPASGGRVAGPDGKFSITLDSEQKYGGEAFEIDVYCGTMPFRGPKPPRPNVQFTITTLQPMWRQTETRAVAAFDYCLPARFWCAILARLGLWVICGKLTTCTDPQPIFGATVKAFDVDWLQDDASALRSPTLPGISSSITFVPNSKRRSFRRSSISNGQAVQTSISVPKVGRQPDSRRAAFPRAAHLAAKISVIVSASICGTDQVPHTGPESTAALDRVEAFNIHASAIDPPHNFLPEGYAGLPAQSFVFAVA